MFFEALPTTMKIWQLELLLVLHASILRHVFYLLAVICYSHRYYSLPSFYFHQFLTRVTLKFKEQHHEYMGLHFIVEFHEEILSLIWISAFHSCKFLSKCFWQSYTCCFGSSICNFIMLHFSFTDNFCVDSLCF